jgi:hypothetical protein
MCLDIQECLRKLLVCLLLYDFIQKYQILLKSKCLCRNHKCTSCSEWWVSPLLEKSMTSSVTEDNRYFKCKEGEIFLIVVFANYGGCHVLKEQFFLFWHIHYRSSSKLGGRHATSVSSYICRVIFLIQWIKKPNSYVLCSVPQMLWLKKRGYFNGLIFKFVYLCSVQKSEWQQWKLSFLYILCFSVLSLERTRVTGL